ncbi:pyruvate, water dikinase regulatory protein [Paenalkalicoccus suaedae]|uniref:pyruvate, water dikinase regulatory protein n=1 Tax=Paenalkalicoccus suaedae TaxID=2592382 RepID=UPI001C375BD5|nr:pyruvate, water dikinase regulatory protein [Paenalkalicoccus suaedae]
MAHCVFVVSDSVGETADRLVQAALTQFRAAVTIERYSFVTDIDMLERIVVSAAKKGAIIAYTFVLPELLVQVTRLQEAHDVQMVDLITPMMTLIQDTVQEAPRAEPGRMRRLDEDYFKRMEAVEFAVKYDDAKRVEEGIKQADLVLIGVSRTSKTPLSMYLAHKQWKVANVPLVPEVAVPKSLFDLPRGRCIGLTLSPDKLKQIRTTRMKSMGAPSTGTYASFERILEEMTYAETIMKRVGCPTIDVTNRAVEETAEYIVDMVNMERGIRL